MRFPLFDDVAAVMLDFVSGNYPQRLAAGLIIRRHITGTFGSCAGARLRPIQASRLEEEDVVFVNSYVWCWVGSFLVVTSAWHTAAR